MIIKTKQPIPASEITNPERFRNRRKIIKTASAAGLAGHRFDNMRQQAQVFPP